MADNPSIAANPNVDDWLSIEADGTVRARSGKVDIGQRISDAIALIVAEELDVALARVEIGQRETGLSPDEGYTSGSESMQQSGAAIRQAAATARRHLLALAAAALDAEPDALQIADGLVRVPASNRAVSYWDLIGGKRFDLPIDPDAPLKPARDYRQIGRPAPARGMAALVAGETRFAQDLQVPGMLHARVVHPPHQNARLKALDAKTLERLAADSIEVVRDGSFLAVAAADEFQAVRAAERLYRAAEWDLGAGLDAGDIHRRLTANPRLSLPVVDGTPRREPVPAPAAPPPEAVTTLSARFERPYQAHAAIAPSAALAHFEGGRLTLRTHSQGIYPLRASLAELLGMRPEALHLIHVPGPGCYGHNGADDAAVDAALVARALPGRPVLLKWSRGDEHAWSPYGSAMVVEVAASLDAGGRIVDWNLEAHSDAHTVRPRPGPNRVGPSRFVSSRFLGRPLEPQEPPPNMTQHGGVHRNADPYYALPRRRIVKHLVRGLPLRTSAMRTLGAYANCFAIESFMDELAAAAGEDALAFRLKHLDDARARAVLQAAADRFGWDKAGRGRGLAFGRYKNSKAYAAVAVALAVGDDGKVRLARAVIAGDAGQVVDADGMAAQLEGGFLQAASWTLKEEVRFDAGGILARDWESYPILGFDEVPEIATVLLDQPDQPYLGVGEGSCIPTAAAIANAIFDATGLRLRRLPFTPEAIRAAALN
jgi:CO/xanthine dehydrogenase Mo-binding subunit